MTLRFKQMTVLEIILLIIGAALCVLGFVIPVKQEELQAENKALLEEQVRKVTLAEIENVRGKVDGITEETIQYAMEKAERSMERISNEKIMAVEEYSNTVLADIHKNHEEVVFLYDMLNDKHENVKNTVAESNKSLKDLVEQAKDIQVDISRDIEEKQNAADEVDHAENTSDFAPFGTSNLEKIDLVEAENLGETVRSMDAKMDDFANEEKPAAKKTASKTTAKKTTKKTTKKSTASRKNTGALQGEAAGNIDLQLGGDLEGDNNNEKILALHKKGKSNMAIAKELGLGIGEVRLVIDLFEDAGTGI